MSALAPTPPETPRTLAELRIALQSVPGGTTLLDRVCITTYDAFVDHVLADIDVMAADMEANPQAYQHRSEDDITETLTFGFRRLGYRARHGEKRGGSVDLTVESWNQFVWTAEAKIYRKVDDLREGFLQLTTRYRPGSNNNARAGVLAYVFRPQVKKLLKEWQTALEAMGLDQLACSACMNRPELAFHSSHTDKTLDTTYRVRHMTFNLYHAPEDKSARGSKKHAAGSSRTPNPGLAGKSKGV